MAIGQALRLHGCWVEHKQYGLQLKATDMEPLSPSTDDEMVAYLGGGAIPGVGPHYAQVGAAGAACTAASCWLPLPAAGAAVGGEGAGWRCGARCCCAM